MAHLALLPPLPPEPHEEGGMVGGGCDDMCRPHPGHPVGRDESAGAEVARGQHAFGFLEVVVFARASRPRRKSKKPKKPRRKRDRRQLAMVLRKRRNWREQAPKKTQLRLKERVQMERDIAELTAAGVYAQRPRQGNGIDGDCPTGPCPWIQCPHHLYVLRRPKSVKVNFPGKDFDQIGETCALRVAAETQRRGTPMPFEEIGEKMGLGAKQTMIIFNRVMRKVRAAGGLNAFRDGDEADDPPPRFKKG